MFIFFASIALQRASYAVQTHQSGTATVAFTLQLDDLNSDDPQKRLLVARQLEHIDPLATDLIPFLRGLRQHVDLQVRKHAIRALAKLVPNSSTAVEAIAENLVDPSAEVQGEAVRALRLAEFLPEATHALLMEALIASEQHHRNAVLGLLEVHTPYCPQVLKQLCTLLKHEDAKLRHFALYSIGRRTQFGVQSLPQLISLQDDPSTNVRRELCLALARLRVQAELSEKVLLKSLQDSDKAVRLVAIEALSNWEELGRKHLSALKELENPDDKELRQALQQAYERLGIMTNAQNEVIEFLEF